MLNGKLCTKLIISGSFIERFKYFLPEKKKKSEKSGKYVVENQISSSISRCRTRLRRLVYANAGVWPDKHGRSIPPKFLTLTFKENIQDLRTANRYLTIFIQKLNYNFRNILATPLRYVCVPEFQERGAIHYHLILFNFPYIDRIGLERLRTIWGGYRIHLKAIRQDIDVSNIIAYVTKYVSKQLTDERFHGQKRYFASRDLKKPIYTGRK